MQNAECKMQNEVKFVTGKYPFPCNRGRQLFTAARGFFFRFFMDRAV